jgi:hemoglobin/transferrin/lactoferrin receptor protein
MPTRTGRTRIFLAPLATTLLGGAALAQDATPQPVTQLPAVEVTATRGPMPLDRVPATVNIIDQLQLERQNAATARDAVRYEPGVSVSNQPARTGQGNFVIRGIGGNRVLVLQDGLRMQDFPASNIGAGTYSRTFVDLDSVRRIEIVRGPASALYGSDAIGGVVNYILKDPTDLLAPGKDAYIAGRIGYHGSDQSLSTTVTGAARAGSNAEVMLIYTNRSGQETQLNGNIQPNPQVVETNSFLARAVIHATPVDTIRITGEAAEYFVKTELRSEQTNTRPSGFIPGSNVLASTGRDTSLRLSVVADWTHDAPVGFVDSFRARLSASTAQRREQTAVYRAVYSGPVVPTTPNRQRLSDFQFNQDLYILDLQAQTAREFWGGNHAFTYGTTVELTQSTRPRERIEYNLTTGQGTTTIGGETFPNKNFPDTTTVQVGAYVQDIISVGRWEITPAIRLDYYNLQPHTDAMSNRASGGLQVQTLTDWAVSPKLGALYRINETLSVYGQYAHGFRAPPYDSTNFGFTNPQSGYAILPNPNLKSESSDGVEIGVRGRHATLNWGIAGFYNYYTDFIDTRVVGQSGGMTLFQYGNLSRVQIWGVEARGEWNFAPNWALRGAAYWADSQDQNGRPLDSVDPAKITLGLSWKSPSGLGADIIGIAAARHSQVSDPNYFQAPAYATMDLLVHYDVNQNVRLNAGLFNVFDTKYYLSNDVVGVARNSANRELFVQPGRYLSANLILRW